MLLSRWLYYLSSIPTLLLGVKNWPKMLAVFLGLPVSLPFVIVLRNGCRFKVRTRMDIWIIKEICLDQQYESASLPFQDGWTVLDIGAGLGDFAVHVARQHPHTMVYAFEPFPASFALLQENLQLNGVPNVRTFPQAISAQSGERAFYIASEAVAHTAVKQPHALSDDHIQVTSITLDQVFGELDIATCDYLKLDCEGAEFEILFGTDTQTLHKIRHLCLEYHDRITARSHQDLVLFLTARGFEVKLTPSPAYDYLGLLYARNLAAGSDNSHPSGPDQTLE
jgi:FkbM family methyltransferase